MNKILKVLFQILLFALPWFLRRVLLNKLFGYKIEKSARIGLSIILADDLTMKSNSYIGSFNFCNAIDTIKLEEYSIIGSFVYITGYSTKLTKHFTHIINRKCELRIGAHSAITSRHFIDCTAGVFVGTFTTVAGIRSQIMTHSINLNLNIQDANPVSIGNYCFIGTECVILGGSTLPDYSVLGAKSLLNKKQDIPYCLYGGVPAKLISKLEKSEVAYFNRTNGFVN